MIKKRLLETSLLAFSLLAHVIVFFSLGVPGDYCFSKPLALTDAVMVVLDRGISGADLPEDKVMRAPDDAVKDRNGFESTGGPEENTDEEAPMPRSQVLAEKDEVKSTQQKVTADIPPSASVETVRHKIPPPLRRTDEFLKSEFEALRYRITMLGIPVGTAELEARSLEGEVRISLKIASNPAVGALYPVNDLIETRHIGGNFIITKIRQQEGSFRSDRGFTIFLRDKSVFWIDLLRNRSDRESLPNSNVLDIFSGLYYLRNRVLQVGKPEMLHIYDSDSYSELPVEVLRRENLRLSGRDTGTIVVRPLFKTEGVFRRTGDMLIWLSEDDNKVPVKIETSIPVGVVTAELVSAESSPGNALQKGN